MDLAYLIVEKPDGYNAKEAQELLARYEGRETAGDGDDAAAPETAEVQEAYPNIIVIMDEAFSDLAVLGNFNASEDYMPFVHELMKGAPNTVSGRLNVSVCGGNTANTEFEFLTGDTMRFFPNGSIPYQQYVRKETDSLAWQLKELGYATVAVHPYNASGWSRDKVYPLLGFDDFYSLKNFAEAAYLRSYVSDETDFAMLRRLYETKEEGRPLFLFNVTMQNHGSYTDQYQNFSPDITVEGGGHNFALMQYLSLLKRTDADFKNLCSYFDAQEERTILVFFGDHQPADAVAATILSLNGMDYRSLSAEQEQLRYQVPYVIHANYDLASETGADTSANYLAAELLSRAGLPLTGYQCFLRELGQRYPVISAVRLTEEAGAEPEQLLTYQRLQYYKMFEENLTE